MRNTVGREVSDREPGVGVTELTWQANRLPGTATSISFSINRQKCILVKAKHKPKFKFQEEKTGDSVDQSQPVSWIFSASLG